MNKSQSIKTIEAGQSVIGIEMGSTRIKAVLIGPDNAPIASGNHDWENRFEDGVWTYSLDDVWTGMQACFADLQADVNSKYGIRIARAKAIGISGMMHGYMVFDAKENQLVPFRTWRNNFTERASEELTEMFGYPIPQRWSIAHLYQAILNGEEHVAGIDHMTTVAGYVHWKLTGQKVMGIGEASGMFPIDIGTQNFNAVMLKAFDARVADQGFNWRLNQLLPKVLGAGTPAGALTAEGAARLDPTGTLQAGIPLCPPEGDAGTGMVATNSIEVRTGNVSAGTSVFAMLVLEKELSRAHSEIDQVTTPDGKLVAMVHSNNCTSDYNAWFEIFAQVAGALGAAPTEQELYTKLLPLAFEGDPDCGGLLSYGYVSGEHVTGFSEGRPLFVRATESRFSLPNFIRCHLFTALCALRTGLNILMDEEGVKVEEIRGHGGFFKTPEVGQRIMAAATGAPVSVLATAGEGGAWGIALLAAFATRENRAATLPQFLKQVFAGSVGKAVAPNPVDAAGFEAYFKRYHACLGVERAAVELL